MITDETLIYNLKNKNPSILEDFLIKYGNLIYKIAYSYTYNKQSSEECVNDVLLKVWNSIDTFTSDHSKFKNWICTLAKYTAIDIFRKKSPDFFNIDEFSFSSNENLEKNYLLKCDIELIKDYLNTLKTIDKEVFIEKIFNNTDSKAISKKLNLTENSVNLKIMRIRKKLIDYINLMEAK